MYMVQKCVNPKEMHEERDQFNNLDLDMDGSISKKELWENLKNLKGQEDIK